LETAGILPFAKVKSKGLIKIFEKIWEPQRKLFLETGKND